MNDRIGPARRVDTWPDSRLADDDLSAIPYLAKDALKVREGQRVKVEHFAGRLTVQKMSQ